MAIDDIPRSAVPTFEALVQWLDAPLTAEQRLVDPKNSNDFFLMMHPRTIWVKDLPADSILFDVGSGSGGLINFCEVWPSYRRMDVNFLGASLDSGPLTEKYSEFYVGDLEQSKPSFSTRPNAVIMSHF